MRWGPLLILLLIGTALAVDEINSGSIGTFVRHSRTFGTPVAFSQDSAPAEEALLWTSEGEVYRLQGPKQSPEFWYKFKEPLLGLTGFDSRVAVVDTNNLTLWTRDSPNPQKLDEWPGNFTGPPQVLDQLLLVPTKEGLTVYTESGWRQTIPAPSPRITTGDINGDGKPEIAFTSENSVYLLESSTHPFQTMRGWPKENIPGTLSTPTITQGKIAVATSQGELRVWDTRGKEILRKQTNQFSAYSDIPAPIFADDLTILFGPQDTIHAFRGENNAWSTTLKGVDNLRFDPILAGNELLIPAQFTLRVLNLEGTELETIEMDGNVKTPILLDLDGDGDNEVLAVSESELAIDGEAFVVLDIQTSGQDPPVAPGLPPSRDENETAPPPNIESKRYLILSERKPLIERYGEQKASKLFDAISILKDSIRER